VEGRSAAVKWVKQGVFLEAPTGLPWSASHAAVPHVDIRSDDALRIYFTTRDDRGRSHVARAEVHGELCGENLQLDPTPVLRPGPPGLFDDGGAMTSCMVRSGGSELLYYQGWSLGVSVPYYVFGSCAVSSDDGNTFVRVAPTPVLDRSPVDPYWTSSPWVLLDDGRWRMWYVAGLGWHIEDEQAVHYLVHIRYAESDDGIVWRREGRVCIDFASPDEYAIARPVVIRDHDCYRMWYSHRGSSYRIGYAESQDGLDWERLDDAVGIDVSAGGFDSDMVEYACVFDYRGRRHMLYNGNGFGASGIGHAILEPDA
jgi:hypothetical protein